MSAKIFETTVTPTEGGTLVQLHISDLPPDAEGAAIRIVLAAKVPAYETPALAQLQREAMKAATEALNELLPNLAHQIQLSNRNLNPKPLQSDKS